MSELKKKFLTVIAVMMIFMQSVTVSVTSEKTTEVPTEKPTQPPTVDNSEEISKKEKEIANLNKKIENLSKQIEDTRFEIAQLRQTMNDSTDIVQDLDGTIRANKEKLKERLRVIYMTGGASRIEVILGAKTFDDLINNLEYASMVAQHDSRMIDKLQSDVTVTKKAKKIYDNSKEELEQKAEELESKRYELLGMVSENQGVLAELYAEHGTPQITDSDADVLEEKIADYYKKKPTSVATEKPTEKATKKQKSSTKTTKPSATTPTLITSNDGKVKETVPSVLPVQPQIIDDIEPATEKENIISTDTDVSSSGYVWPVTGFYYLTSLWNEDRGAYNHGAIDIAGYGIEGQNVLAAHSGTVAYAENNCVHNWGKLSSCGCGGGYGNYVMLEHGDGHMTVYAHMSSVLVSAGDTVSAGQVLGFVGSTGDSTGAHLHFETRFNGAKYNPMTEYLDIPVSYSTY